jgi:hypothetical protein
VCWSWVQQPVDPLREKCEVSVTSLQAHSSLAFVGAAGHWKICNFGSDTHGVLLQRSAGLLITGSQVGHEGAWLPDRQANWREWHSALRPTSVS